jgi:hypothetical protein
MSSRRISESFLSDFGATFGRAQYQRLGLQFRSILALKRTIIPDFFYDYYTATSHELADFCSGLFGLIAVTRKSEIIYFSQAPVA